METDGGFKRVMKSLSYANLKKDSKKKKRMNKKLLGIVILLILIKILLAMLITVPLGFSDSLTHLEGAKTFFANPSLSSAISTQKYTLFPLLISPLLFFKDMGFVYFLILVLNAIISSLIIFPTYKIAKEFLHEKESILVATVIAMLPAIFISSFYIMSEALFSLLLITSLYLIFQAYTKQKKKWDILAGISVAATLLTKSIGIILIPIVFFLFLRAIKNKQWSLVKTKILLGLSTFLFLLPFFIAKGQKNGFTLAGILGYSNEITNITHATNPTIKILWLFFYTDYIILASTIICACIFIYALLNYKKKNEKEKIILQLTFWLLIGTILIAANNASYFSNIEDTRIIGRYVEINLVLLILTSIVFIRDWKSHWDFQKTLILLLITITTPFILTRALFPLNNTGLSLLGTIQIIFQLFKLQIWLATIPLLIVVFLILKIKKLKANKFLYFLFLYFLIISLLSTSMIIYDANKNWASLEETELGQWININLAKNATFLIDINDMLDTDFRSKSTNVTETKDRPITVIGYWIYGNYTITDVTEAKKFNYIISTQDLPYDIVKEGETIKIYKVNAP